MNSWLIQCAVSEAFQMNESFSLKREEYAKKLLRKNELVQKEILIKSEKKELRKLKKLKEPKIVFGRKKIV